VLGFSAARNVVITGRSAFFPPEAPDLPVGRHPLIQKDDLVPQFGYVGDKYTSSRTLLLAINPGNGDSQRRSPADERMMPSHHQFAQSPAPENFKAATTAYRQACETWRQWSTTCSGLINEFSFDEVAYSNCLPWRTASEAKFGDLAASTTARAYLRPLLEDLRPKLIIALGKTRVPEILAMTGLALPRVVPWTRARALTDAVRRERAEALAVISALKKTQG
jgi:hypothetical protein